MLTLEGFCIAAGAVTVGAITTWYFLKQKLNTSGNAQINAIHVYPVKSVGGFSVQQWPIDEYGLKLDRQWMIIKTGKNKFLTQRECPKMSLISATLSKDLLNLTLEAPNRNPIVLNTSQSADLKQIEVEIWARKFDAQDLGDDVATWLSEFIGTSVRLVRTPQNHLREPPQKYMQDFLALNPQPTNNTSFADGFPLLLGAEKSLQDLNTKISQQEHKPVDMLRFRPNVVVTGTKRPYEEEEWHTIKIGSLTFYNVKPCSICTMPNVNYTEGKKDTPVREILEQFRYDAVLDAPIFAINLVHATDTHGKIMKVGDEVIINKWQEPRKIGPKM